MTVHTYRDTEERVQRLDRQCARFGLSRTGGIRQAITEWLEKHERSEAEQVEVKRLSKGGHLMERGD